MLPLTIQRAILLRALILSPDPDSQSITRTTFITEVSRGRMVQRTYPRTKSKMRSFHRSSSNCRRTTVGFLYVRPKIYVSHGYCDRGRDVSGFVRLFLISTKNKFLI